MANSYTISIVVSGKDDASSALSNVERGLQKVSDTAKASSGGVGGFFRDAFSFATGGLVLKGVEMVGGALVDMFSGAMGDARGTQALMAATDQVIKSMGNSAGVSSQHVADFAASLSDASGKSLFGDDQIQASTNMLLTFGNIKGEMLDLATTMTVDMGQALKKTPEQMSVVIGKLLNSADAMSAAKKMGVSFTDEQVALGKAMFEAGDIAGYQKLVLAELNKEYGGQAQAAAAAAGGAVQFTARMGELAESVAAQALPLLDQLGAFAANVLAPALESIVGGAITFLSGTAIPALSAAWVSLQPTIVAVIGQFNQLATFWTSTLQPAAAQIVTFIQANLQPIMYGLVAVLLTVVVPAFVAWAAGAVAAATATIVALAPVILPILAIGAAVAVLKAAWDNDWGGIRTTLTDFWTTTGQPIFDQLVAWLQINLPIAIQTLTDFWNTVLLPALNAVWSFISANVIPIIVEIITVHFAALKIMLQSVATFWNTILLPAITAVWSFLTNSIIPLIKALIDVHFALFQVAMIKVTELWGLMKGAFLATWGFIQGYLMPTLKLLANAALGPLADMGKTAGGVFNNVFKPALTGISDAVTSTVSPALSTLSGIIDGVKGAIGGIADVISGAISALHRLADAIRSMPSMPSLGGGSGALPGFASGTSFAPGGMAWVGERGPELVNLPRGSQVFTNAQSQRMGSGTTYHITYYGTGNQDERSVRDDIRYLQMLQG